MAGNELGIFKKEYIPARVPLAMVDYLVQRLLVAAAVKVFVVVRVLALEDLALVDLDVVTSVQNEASMDAFELAAATFNRLEKIIIEKI